MQYDNELDLIESKQIVKGVLELINILTANGSGYSRLWQIWGL